MSPSSSSATPRKRKKRKLPKIVSASEATSLFSAVDDGSDVGIRNRLILEFMYRAGLRVSEVVALTPRQVHAEGVIDIFDAKGGDGTAYFDADRVIPLLERWMRIRSEWANGSKLLFVRPDGKPVSVRYIQRLVKKTKDDAGIVGICTPHVLRHTFATELLEEGLSIVEVQKAMRHANLATTEVYLHVRDNALRSKISQRSKGGE